jgi:hypothetical protein
MEGAARPLSLLEILDRAADVLGMTRGRWELQLVFHDGYCVEARPAQKPGKLTREQLDRIVLPVAPVT